LILLLKVEVSAFEIMYFPSKWAGYSEHQKIILVADSSLIVQEVKKNLLANSFMAS